MFRKARVKLTAWYLVIIMFVSICFSVVIYKALTFELNRFERVQRARIERMFFERPRPFDRDVIEETKNRLKIFLILINLAILGGSSVAGYFLAGRTLKPIADMVEEQNRFITDSSHELRTPLTSLKTEIEVGLRDEKLNLEEAKKLLKSNLEEANNLQKLSDELIKLTQYQKTGNGIGFTDISLVKVIDEAMKKMAKIVKSKQIKILKNVKDVNFIGDEQSLVELLVILLDNAIKYSPVASTVKIAAEKRDRHVEFSVSDSGIGIDEEDLPHIFDRFYRSSKSRSKNEIAGYGLGLSIAKQIVEKHFGSITAESEIKKGTKVTVVIPK